MRGSFKKQIVMLLFFLICPIITQAQDAVVVLEVDYFLSASQGSALYEIEIDKNIYLSLTDGLPENIRSWLQRHPEYLKVIVKNHLLQTAASKKEFGNDIVPVPSEQIKRDGYTYTENQLKWGIKVNPIAVLSVVKVSEKDCRGGDQYTTYDSIKYYIELYDGEEARGLLTSSNSGVINGICSENGRSSTYDLLVGCIDDIDFMID
ncbi:MAG: hypothetical protein R3A45_12250 [Bdellovibrionota bacterium]